MISDSDQTREYWVEIVRSASDRGRLETIPTTIAKTARERDTARNQNYWLSRKSFGGFHPNYERIRWKS